MSEKGLAQDQATQNVPQTTSREAPTDVAAARKAAGEEFLSMGNDGKIAYSSAKTAAYVFWNGYHWVDPTGAHVNFPVVPDPSKAGRFVNTETQMAWEYDDALNEWKRVDLTQPSPRAKP